MKETFAKHRRIIFDGNGYSDEWEREAERRGLLNLRDSVEAYKCFDLPKNIELFAKHGVMSATEITSRKDILFENYSKIINIEALTMIEMAARDIIPAVSSYIGNLASGLAAKTAAVPAASCAVENDIIIKLSELNSKAYAKLGALKSAEAAAAKIEGAQASATAYRDTVIPAMAQLRAVVDQMETLTASNYWPLPSYGEMMFNV